MARGQTLAPLGTAPLEHQTTRLRAHPFTKTVGLRPAAVIRLECSLHNFRLLNSHSALNFGIDTSR